MTACAIDTLFCTTGVPFELVIFERLHPARPLGAHSLQARISAMPNCLWVAEPTTDGPNQDANRALALCKAPKVVYTGNDVFVRDGWLEALLECFQHPDCGAATLASRDLKHHTRPTIAEGIYGPFMMFDRSQSFDADTFPSAFGDSDLIMRLYAQGKRQYRNWRVVIEHLNAQTINGPEHQRDFEAALARFKTKHEKSSHLLMYRVLTEGIVI